MLNEEKINQPEQQVIAIVVVTCLIGLIGFASFDESSRSSFERVAEMVLTAYLGYLIQNGK
ncbi:MAG: hypothetical protein N2235_10650 [Fischerella sp.]|nr:hypothetical protein [Fischerella sp.]